LGPFLHAAELLRDARRRHGVDQRTLAARAGASQTHISRIERGEVAPSTATLSRLLAALGDRLELSVVPAAPPGSRGYLPPHDAERRCDFLATTPAKRVAEAISLSRTATRIAAAARSSHAC